MANTYAQAYALAQNVSFQEQVRVAACNAAIAIQAEATSTANHTNRANYAKLVLNSPESYAPLFAAAITSNDFALTTSTADATVQNDVNAVWNALAGTI